MKENIIKDKSFRFAVRMVNLYKFLKDEKKEHEMSKQLYRAGTSIGANVHEALRAVSKKDFINKMGIALKEASESEYWLELLYATQHLDKTQYESIIADCSEINKLLISIVKNSNEEKKE